jgi:mono/diheme cytochrome c family protein
MAPAMSYSARAAARTASLLVMCALEASCDDPMRNQPRYEPLEATMFFADRRSSRHLVPGTVPRRARVADFLLETGRTADGPATVFPIPITQAVLERGQERYDIYCAPCHSRTGDGDGIIVRRGFSKPPSLFVPRLQGAPPGHYFGVITDGWGAMPAYGYMVPPLDRWAIIAYIEALQLSQGVPVELLAPDLRAKLPREPQ